nr:hypothetical protein [Tanacetum cinerariifolium]
MYSTTVLEIVVLFCFFEDQLTNLSPKNYALSEFLSQKDSGVGRGVKEKDQNRNKMITTLSTGLSMETYDTMNEDTMVVIAPDVKEIGITHVVDMTAEKEKQCILDDTTVLGSFPPLPTQVTTLTGNSPSKSSYANVTGKPREKKLNIRTLFTSRGNGIDVVVPMESIRAISDQFANTAYGFFLGKQIAYHVAATLRSVILFVSSPNESK